MAIRPVRGILPSETAKIFSGEMEPEEIFIQSVEGTDAETAKNAKQQAKDEKAFNQIRRNLVLQAFGMTEEQYQRFMTEYEKVKSGEYDFKMSEADQVQRDLDVAETQRVSNARGKFWRSKKGVALTILGTIVAGAAITTVTTFAAPLLLAKLAPWLPALLTSTETATAVVGTAAATAEAAGVAVSAEVATGAASAMSGIGGELVKGTITAGLGIGGTVIAGRRAKKLAPGNVGDYEEKQLAAIEKLIPLMEKIKKLEDTLEADKTMIMAKKNTLKEAEFNDFMVGYLKEKMDALGLANDLKAQANEVAQKRVDANNDLSMDEEQEEFDQEQEELDQEQEELDPELDEEMKRKMIENGIQME